ncbi:MAG: flagellar export chaperone FliS [Clostridiales bacterium]|nr:flagellar export chaperone FliS [Clostridiales bacterium]
MQQQVMLTNAQEVYRQQKILTASPMELILMLYDGIRKDLLQAQIAIEKKNMQMAHDKLINAQDIVIELINSLDFKYSISNELLSIYEFLQKLLQDINVKKDASLIPEAMELVGTLKEAWIQVDEDQKKKKASLLEEE